MVLSDRLMMVISMIPRGSTTADIGTDHGWVPIYLIEHTICPFVYAMDVRPGPLSQAESHVREAGLTGSIETRLSDGLTKLAPSEADTILIAGMGGDLIARILTEGREKIENCDLILSPHAECEKVRGWLYENGFSIIEEKMVREDGKFYTAIHAIPDSRGEQAADPLISEGELIYGRYLLREKNPILLELLTERKEKLAAVRAKLGDSDSPSAAAARERLTHELSVIEETVKEYYYEVQ